MVAVGAAARGPGCGWRAAGAAAALRLARQALASSLLGLLLGDGESGRACVTRGRAGRWVEDERRVASGLRDAQRNEFVSPRRDSCFEGASEYTLAKLLATCH